MFVLFPKTTLWKQVKKIKIYHLKIPYFLSLRIENRKQFLIIKYIFDIFCSKEQKIVPNKSQVFRRFG